MAKFVIIEPSIKDFTGHYLEHATRILSEAARIGYTPVLATNRKFKLKLPNLEVQPVYRHGFWFESASPRWMRYIRWFVRTLSGFFHRWRIKLAYSPFGLLWSVRDRPGDYLRSRFTYFRFDSTTALVVLFYGVLGLISGLRLALVLLPFKGYFRQIATQVNIAMNMAWRPIRLLLQPNSWLRFGIWRWLKISRFRDDTWRLFRRVRLEEGDIVLLFTVSAAEVLGLREYFQRDPLSTRASWHLLFRHQLFTTRIPLSREPLRPISYALLQVSPPLSNRRIFCHADTAELATQYNSLKVIPFHTLPLPISRDLYNAGQKRHANTPLQIAYVGDARKEKGYHYLPRIVQDLWLDYVRPRRVRFVIQSNFNVEGGTAATAIALTQLQSFPPDMVELLRKPLSSSDYRDLVVGSDIILLPYDPEIYYAGSSGILAEAHAAGIPVIVPEGLWMSRQFAEETSRHHIDLHKDLRLMMELAHNDLRWRSTDSQATPPSFNGHLDLSQSPYLELSVPVGSEYMLLSFRTAARVLGGYVCAYVDQMDCDGLSLRRTRTYINEAGSRATMLAPLEPLARRVYLSLAPASDLTSRAIYDVQLQLLARHMPDQACPRGAVGLTYNDPEEISFLLRDMITHYEHYRKTALAFSVRWFEENNAQHLMAQIEALERSTERPHLVVDQIR